MIHNGKVFKSVRGGVRILDCHTMQWKFIGNSWYDENKLAEVMQNKFVRFKRESNLPEFNWIVADKSAKAIEVMKKSAFDLQKTIGKKQRPSLKGFANLSYFPFLTLKKGYIFAFNH